MHAEIAALARKHVIGPALLADLNALWERRVDATILVDGDEPVGSLPSALDEDTHEPELIGGRYVDLGPIGTGGMGEVRRVRDVTFNRTLAMKTIHARLVDKSAAVGRFVEEAQATGQLQHPGIVPIHDLGTLPDGRVWFTMREVRGRTLADVVREVHAAATERWNPGATGFTFRRLVASFMQACHAVAYAHERGVVHRDLKPENVMIGAHGEVVVLDWGLAKLVGRQEHAFAPESTGELRLAELASAEGSVVTARSSAHATRVGTVAGTPAYMAPEQARGEVDRLDARADVYALGALLYEILSGRPPYEGSPHAILAAVLEGPPLPPDRTGRPPLPEELVAACERAMARDPGDRFSSALALAAEVEAWLDGARRREQALAVVERAEGLVAEAGALVAQAGRLRAESAALLAGVATWEPEERKAPGWDKATEADTAALAAELKQLEVEQTLLAALQISADLPEAHAALAERHLASHVAAEAARQPLAKSEVLLRSHAMALPGAHPVRQRVAAYLKGDGAVTLVTDPPGAEVALYRYVERNRRLVEVFERSLGTTPLRTVSLPMGSYLAVVRHPACTEVRYPFEVVRHGHWDGVAPGEREAQPVWLPPSGLLGGDEVFVPAGWFRAGGDPEGASLPAARRWCDPLVVQRFPVTNREYLAFLDDLVAVGREAEALQHAPRERSGTEGGLGALIYGYDGTRFSLRADADADAWLPDWPVFMVDWKGARAYLAWLADRTGRPWRLPAELEWEKAARGVDGRGYPWGDFLDPSWCRMTDSHRERRLPAVVDSHPVDISPYGVRGLGGNLQDWCLDLFDAPTPTVDHRVTPPDTTSYETSRAPRVIRGGSWSSNARGARCGFRLRSVPELRNPNVGFRGVFRPVESEE